MIFLKRSDHKNNMVCNSKQVTLEIKLCEEFYFWNDLSARKKWAQFVIDVVLSGYE